jgi:hypothetical protein
MLKSTFPKVSNTNSKYKCVFSNILWNRDMKFQIHITQNGSEWKNNVILSWRMFYIIFII